MCDVGYTTVFDASQTGIPWFALAFLLPPVGVFTVRRTLIGAGKNAPPPSVIVATTLLAVVLAWSSWVRGQKDKRACGLGQCGTVAGTVELVDTGLKLECFSVEMARFCYSDYLITRGFHRTRIMGGPIREGLPVRIAYRKSDYAIMRLEIGNKKTRDGR
jgi:hypothetical protein